MSFFQTCSVHLSFFKVKIKFSLVSRKYTEFLIFKEYFYMFNE